MRNGAPADARARPPVLVLTGVGLTAAVALRCVAEIEEHFDVIAPSDGDPPTPAGALALLDAAGAEQAHVVGLSFGGTIAQEIAITHPQRIRSLVLALIDGRRRALRAGGPGDPRLPRPPRRATRRGGAVGVGAVSVRRDDLPPARAAYRRGHRSPADAAGSIRAPIDRQHAVARAHDAGARLAEIPAPTLVLHGDEDRILPLDNGQRLADGIAGARFVPLPGGAHAFPTDVPELDSELVSFLLEHSPRRAGSAARRSGRAARA